MMYRLIFILAITVFILGCSSMPQSDYEAAEFEALGDVLVMTGIIDSNTQRKLEIALDNNPGITTIVMQDVEGSVDDEANLVAARYVRRKGLNTHIPDDGMVASGGTDFFLSGVKRTSSPTAEIGVHSWEDSENIEGNNLSKNHPLHNKYLEYYRTMGIPESFYWFTLDAASAESIHWMSIDEQKFFKITTD